MKKNFVITLLLSVLLVGLVLTGCQTKDEGNNVLKIGATPVPHAQLLELVKDDLKEQGIELQIIEFTDYVKPNLALSDGEIDANFFQHVPYMESFSKEHKLDLVSLGTVHVEPLGLYSKSLKSVDDLGEGSVIALPNDPTNEGRALILLQNNGLITLKEDAGLEATINDIVDNPKGLSFKELEAAQLPRVLQDVDAAIINGNYALESDLVPTTDALLLEGSESPYANIITIRNGDENNDHLKALLKALQSDEVRNYIEKNYSGGVVPAF